MQNVLSEALFADLSGRGDLRTFDSGDVLITEGELSDSLYILIVGELKVYTRDRRGRELVYNVLGPGEFFGEMWLDGGARSASVKAVRESKCVVVSPQEFRCFMARYPEFAECLIVKLIARVRRATEQIKSLALNGVYERVVALLNENAVEEGGVRTIGRTMTQQEIADRIGATREMVNHVLRDLIRGGFLVRGDDRKLVLAKALPRNW